jgi:hypothetical protein
MRELLTEGARLIAMSYTRTEANEIAPILHNGWLQR